MAETFSTLWQTFCQAFAKGMRESWRGYFAPIRPYVWLAAWKAATTLGARWQDPFRAWGAAYERIVYGRNGD